MSDDKYMFRTLFADEIDVRIGSVINTPKWQGVTLLLYKNARVDMDILDNTVGPSSWQRRHVEIKGNLYCQVGIYDDCLKTWTWKEDCGIESFSDKEKGEASDAFKRACVNWGIGRELYTAPNIMYPCEVEISSDGKKKSMKHKTDFYVSEIEYDERRRISKLVINKTTPKDEIIFTYEANKKSVAPAPVSARPANKETVATAATETTKKTQSAAGKSVSGTGMSYEEASNFSLGSGKYANVPFCKVPTFYLEWIVKKYDEGKAKTAAKTLLEQTPGVKPQTKPELIETSEFDDDSDIPF